MFGKTRFQYPTYLFFRIAQVLKESEQYTNDTETGSQRHRSNRKIVVRLLCKLILKMYIYIQVPRVARL